MTMVEVTVALLLLGYALVVTVWFLFERRPRSVRVQPSRYFNVKNDIPCEGCGETIKAGDPAIVNDRVELVGYRCDCDVKR